MKTREPMNTSEHTFAHALAIVFMLALAGMMIWLALAGQPGLSFA